MVKSIGFDLDGVLTIDKTGSVTTSKYLRLLHKGQMQIVRIAKD